jgi:hypothetical protein
MPETLELTLTVAIGVTVPSASMRIGIAPATVTLTPTVTGGRRLPAPTPDCPPELRLAPAVGELLWPTQYVSAAAINTAKPIAIAIDRMVLGTGPLRAVPRFNGSDWVLASIIHYSGSGACALDHMQCPIPDFESDIEMENPPRNQLRDKTHIRYLLSSCG